MAIGGGSPIDLAKGGALFATHEGPLSRYAGMAAMPLIGSQAAPLVAVPTTAGTGSEVGRGALICLADGRKLVFVSQHLLPRRAICDPDLTLPMPRGAHRRHRHGRLRPLRRDLSFAPLQPAGGNDRARWRRRGARRWIERAVSHPHDREARSEMMMAGIQGGLAFQKGLGAARALSHPLGAR